MKVLYRAEKTFSGTDIVTMGMGCFASNFQATRLNTLKADLILLHVLPYSVEPTSGRRTSASTAAVVILSSRSGRLATESPWRYPGEEWTKCRHAGADYTDV